MQNYQKPNFRPRLNKPKRLKMPEKENQLSLERKTWREHQRKKYIVH